MAKLEPSLLASDKTQNPLSGGVNLRWSGIMAGVRTYWQDKSNWFYIPELSLETVKIN